MNQVSPVMAHSFTDHIWGVMLHPAACTAVLRPGLSSIRFRDPASALCMLIDPTWCDLHPMSEAREVMSSLLRSTWWSTSWKSGRRATNLTHRAC